MAQQEAEPTYLVVAGVTAKEALAQARAANLVTRRRWPAVMAAVTAIQTIGAAECATPSVHARTA